MATEAAQSGTSEEVPPDVSEHLTTEDRVGLLRAMLMMRGIEEWNRHAVAAVRDPAGNIVTPGHDPYGGTGEWSFRRNGEAIKAYWAPGLLFEELDLAYVGVIDGHEGDVEAFAPGHQPLPGDLDRLSHAAGFSVSGCNG